MIDKGINVKKIDLSGISFPTSDASTCAHIYTAVRNTYGFPLYLTNFKINDEKRDSVLVNPIILENQTIINLNDCHLIVTPTEISVGNGVYGASLESIVDSHGNKRFIEGNLVTRNIEGITFDYAKWSLSGTHLMLVLGLSIAGGTTTPADTNLASALIPSYILDKVMGLWNLIVDIKDFEARNSITWWEDLLVLKSVLLRKGSDRLDISTSGNTIAVTNDSTMRIQFDLLIDSE